MQKRLIHDLRSSLDLLEDSGDKLERISEPVNAYCEIAAIYAKRGGGIPVPPPTRKGPACLFERAMPADARVLVGLFGSRERCATLLGAPPDRMAHRILDAVSQPIPPVCISDLPRKETIRTRVDLRSIPILTTTDNDAGPFITLGLVMAKDPKTGKHNLSIHRMCVQGTDKLTIWMVPGRHLETLYRNAQEAGLPLPVSIHIGVDPAIYFASCCSEPLIPRGFDELGIAGGIRGRAVGLSPCLTVDIQCIYNAEYVLEGEILHETKRENPLMGHAMPEFLGYEGMAHPALPVIRIKAITSRRDPIWQAVIGPGYEQSNLLAVPMEAAVLRYASEQAQVQLTNAYCSSAGGGQLLLALQVEKRNEVDDAELKRLSELILREFRMIKHLVLVDEDVDLFSEEDLWWAMTTRFQADQDLYLFPNLLGFPLDPSQSPQYSPSIKGQGRTTKAVFDCTVPLHMKERFRRACFK